jgi:putative membrane protein
MGAIWSFVVAVVVAAVVIMIVSRLNLGLGVSGFMSAAIASVVIAVVGAVVLWLMGLLGLSIGGGFLGTLVYLVVAAIVLNISDKFVPGMKVNGFMGGVVAAIGIGVVYWLLSWLLGLVGIAI